MNRLFSPISSDESTLDQRHNDQSTNQQLKKGEDQRNQDSNKHETIHVQHVKETLKLPEV